MNSNKILFLTLRVFSATGGIEKVCRIAGKAFHELAQESTNGYIEILSLYDNTKDVNEKYFPNRIFTGFCNKRLIFFKSAINAGTNSDIVFLSHVNLLLIGYIIKLLSPKTKLVLLAHGIELWSSLPWWKKKMLRKCDHILPVSDFTKNKMMLLYQLPEEKFTILNNCLDPFLPAVLQTKSQVLLHRYGFNETDKILLSLTRMAYKERYKGYDQVLQTIHELKEKYPTIKYLLVGKCDALEKERLDIIIARLDLKNHIVFTGFIPDEDLAVHYNLANLYIMPSQKEGFGIVFIEAMFYGKPVIAGNVDGSVDALKNGIFGLLVNPTCQGEITAAVVEVFNHTQKYIPKHDDVLMYFSFEVYKKKLTAIIDLKL